MPSLHFTEALLPGGWSRNVRITITGTRIARIEADAAPALVDERHAIGIPGLPNLHSHAFQRGMAGLAERRGPSADSFWTWREEMYRFLRVLDPADVQAIAAMAYAEMLESGFTRVGEFHYLHHAPNGQPYDDLGAMAESIVAAAARTGMALTLLPCFYAHAGFGGQPPGPGQIRFVNSVDQFARLFGRSRDLVSTLPGSTIGIAPHSLRAVTPEEIAAIIEFAGTGPIHIHAAEQTREVEDSIAWSGKRPVEWLLENQAVDRRWCLIHATHMKPDETRRLASSGAVAGLCPITEANLGDGIFDGATYRDAQGRFGIGTDSNIQISAAAELRQLEYAQRLGLRLRNVMVPPDSSSVGRHLFDAALLGGAQALGVEGPVGLAEGALANIVTLNADHPSLAVRASNLLLDGWIFAASTQVIDCVWSLGNKVVVDGSHVRRSEIETCYRAVMQKIIG